MKNITIFTGSLSGGGAERVIANLSSYLSGNYNVTILTMSDIKESYSINKNVERISLSKSNQAFLIRNLKRLQNFIKYIIKNDVDLYISLLPTTSFMLLLFKKIHKSPILLSERSDPTARFNNSYFKKQISKNLFKRADGFVFQTDQALQFYKQNLNIDGIIIPNAIDVDFIVSEPVKKRKNKIVTVGRLNKSKNISLLLKSFALIEKYFPNHILEIFGDGPEKDELLDLSASLGISDKVKFWGYVENLKLHLIDAALFVLPSNFEGMPNALIEAMSLGVPSISTDCPVGGPKFLIDHGINGYLVETNNIDDMSERIKEVLEDELLSLKFSNNAVKVRDKLHPNVIYSKWENYIESILNKNRNEEI